MTAVPQPYVRRRTLVNALHAATDTDLWAAHAWLHQAGVRSAYDSETPRVRIEGPAGVRMSLGLGQWLVHDPSFGSFEVHDPFDFRCLFAPHGGIL